MAPFIASRPNLRVLGWSLAALLLLIPAVAMHVTSEINWGPLDFLAAAVLLGGAGICLELVVRFTQGKLARTVFGGLVVLAMLLVWAELAVGILPQ